MFPPNDRKLESIALEGDGSDGGPLTLVTRIDGVEHRVACGRDAWATGRAAWGRQHEQPAAASGAWTAGDTFTAKTCFYETPFILTLNLTFAGEDVRCAARWNVGFGATVEPELVGGRMIARAGTQKRARPSRAVLRFNSKDGRFHQCRVRADWSNPKK